LYTSDSHALLNTNQVKDNKPDNVLVNYREGSARFSDVQLGDCGDTCMVDPNADPLEEGHVIGAAIFRSPEAMESYNRHLALRSNSE
jgi:hypothetical protein